MTDEGRQVRERRCIEQPSACEDGCCENRCRFERLPESAKGLWYCAEPVGCGVVVYRPEWGL